LLIVLALAGDSTTTTSMFAPNKRKLQQYFGL